MRNLTILSFVIAGSLMAAPLMGMAADQPKDATKNTQDQTTMQKTGQYMDDAAITAKVKSELMGEPGLKSFNINVETYNGKVQLSGFVDNKATVDRAGEKAKAVNGVQSVINSLQVK